MNVKTLQAWEIGQTTPNPFVGKCVLFYLRWHGHVKSVEAISDAALGQATRVDKTQSSRLALTRQERKTRSMKGPNETKHKPSREER